MDLRSLALLGAASGDKVLSPFGGALLHDIAAREKLASEAPDRAAKAELHAEQMRKLAEGRAAEAHPATKAARLAVVQSYAPDLVEQFKDAPPQVLEGVIKHLEAKYKIDEASAAKRAVADTAAESRKTMRQSLDDQRKEREAAKTAAELDKRFTKFGESLNVARGRMGEAGKALGALQQIESDKALIEQNPNPTRNQLYEIVRGLDRVISNAAPTIGATEHLMPNTLRGILGNAAQWATNEPVGAGAQAFVKQISETLDRIKAQKEKFIGKTLGQSVTSYSDLHAKDPERFLAQLASAGIDPSHFDQANRWAYKGPPKAMPERKQGKDGKWYVKTAGVWEPE